MTQRGPSPAAEASKIRTLLTALNEGWLAGDLEAVAALFHENVVIVSPGFRARVAGREACLDSYRQFLVAAKVRASSFSEPIVDVWGATALASYEYDLTYEMGSELHDDRGRDVWVLAREGESWTLVWRTILPPSDADVWGTV